MASNESRYKKTVARHTSWQDRAVAYSNLFCKIEAKQTALRRFKFWHPFGQRKVYRAYMKDLAQLSGWLLMSEQHYEGTPLYKRVKLLNQVSSAFQRRANAMHGWQVDTMFERKKEVRFLTYLVNRIKSQLIDQGFPLEKRVVNAKTNQK